MAPVFSICIPTYNRAAILDDCLTRLEALQKFSNAFEIVVSDNASTDSTAQILEAHRARTPQLRFYRMTENRGSVANLLNAFIRAEGEIVIYLADDDSLIHEHLVQYVERMVREPDISAIYTDWLAWDDDRGVELHRYFGLDAPVSFRPDQPLDLYNFVVLRRIPPEIGIFRRLSLLRSYTFIEHSLPFHIWMYYLSRQGRIVFDPLPFYREHRVLKRSLQRTHWANMDMQLRFIGDEMRLTLESVLLLALHDSGVSQLPADQMAVAKASIDQFLHARLGLEVDRAAARRDWILAVELKRRQTLWSGPGNFDAITNDVRRLSLPAALQAVQRTYRSLSGADGLSLRGFTTNTVADFFAANYPDIRVLVPKEACAHPLILHRDEQSLAQDPSVAGAGNVFVLERLLNLYRVVREKVDVSLI
jgi:hypothetical protein